MLKNSNVDSIDHLATHSKMAVMDQAAVDKLKALLSNGGKIMESFNHGDKWPNQDGYFELVPTFSRKPIQNFFVQIKGTSNYEELDEGIKYKLTSLGFPSYIKNEISLDPGILFVVLNPTEQDEERFFWKYMSNNFVDSVDYTKTYFEIIFKESDEIKKNNIDSFCNELLRISETHSFIKTMDKRVYNLDTAERLLVYKNKMIEECLDSCNILSDDDRENISLSMLQFIKEFCFGALLVNNIKIVNRPTTIRRAWETAVINRETRFLADFFRYLEYIGNRIPDYGQSERLMLKYYHSLWKTRELLVKYDIHVLNNLEKFPLKINEVDKKYYESVATSIELAIFQNSREKNILKQDALYYIKKNTPFLVNNKFYYELTLQSSNCFADKQNRITVYSSENIETKYSIQIGYYNAKIDLWGNSYHIKVISGWRVRIAPRCLNNYAKIIGYNMKINSNYNEYNELMNYLTDKGANLLDLLDLEEVSLDEILNNIFKNDKTRKLKTLFTIVNEKYNKSTGCIGKYTIRLLLHDLREEIIDRVLPPPINLRYRLKETPAFLTRGCYSFENNPLFYNLNKSKTNNLTSLLSEVTGIEYFKNYLPYIYLKNYTQSTGEIYCEANSVVNTKSVSAYNDIITSYDKCKGFEILIDEGKFCVKSFRDNTISILNRLLEITESVPIEEKGEKSRRENVIKQLDIDIQKEDILKNALRKSKLLLIYGAAGTGKTTIIKHISKIFNDKKRLYLTYTKSALFNLKSKLRMNDDINAVFSTLKKLQSGMSIDKDIIFIDECSVIDNLDILDFLNNKLSSKSKLVLVGDIHQIESIDFGNWFFYAKNIINSDKVNYELNKNWRTKEQSLRDLWNEVRNHGDKLTEILAVDGPFTQDIGPDIMVKQDDEEIILCLNYDGKFGLNNINSYMQNASSEKTTYSWREWNYKIGDPILFIESKRFPELYNNLKGRIVDINQEKDVSISFVIDVDDELPDSDEYHVINRNENTTRIQLVLYNCDELDCEEDDEQMKSIAPFQLAYAVSIHKSQGLEYNSVKIVIPEVNAEKISYDIFYTAITRAKKKLKIYCSTETMTDVVDRIKEHSKSTNSLEIIKKYLKKAQTIIPPVPIMKDESYYVADGEKSDGPYTFSALKEMIDTGKIVASTLLWKQGMDNWKQASLFKELDMMFDN